MNNDYGSQCNSLFDCIRFSLNCYFYWSGRILGEFMAPFRSLFGDFFISVFIALIYLGIFLCACRIIRKSWENVFLHPLDYIILFLVVFYLNMGVDFLLMWTMVAQYSFSILLILIYGIIQDNYFQRKEIKIKDIIIYNLFGLIVGITHEIYIVLICILLLTVFITIKEKRLKIFKYNIGLVIGAILCFFAPGNFNRTVQSHEQNLQISYVQRLIKNFVIHLRTLAGVKCICAIILISIFILFICKFIKTKRIKINRYCYYWMGVLFFSIFIWAIVAVPNSYSMLFFVVFVWITVYTLFIENFEKYDYIIGKRSNIIALSLFALLILVNFGWIKSNFTTQHIWKKKIKEAVEKNYESVEVPFFDEKYSNRFNMLNYNNNQEEFLTEYYLKYYKILVIPKEL